MSLNELKELVQPIPAIVLKEVEEKKVAVPAVVLSDNDITRKGVLKRALKRKVVEEEKKLNPEKPKRVPRERISVKKMRSKKGKKNPLDDVTSVEPAPTNDVVNEELKEEWLGEPMFLSFSMDGKSDFDELAKILSLFMSS